MAVCYVYNVSTVEQHVTIIGKHYTSNQLGTSLQSI